MGEALRLDALKPCQGLADQVGVHAIEVDAIDELARRFSGRCGFMPLSAGAPHLSMTLATVRDAFRQT